VATNPGTIRQLLLEDGGTVLGIMDGEAGASVLRRWQVSSGAPVERAGGEALPPPRINSLVHLAGGDLLSASRFDGQLQRWHRDGKGGLRRGAVIPTDLEGIGSLALFNEGRQLLIGSVDRRSGGQDVRIFDLSSREWVGRPLRLNSGWASALAVLPDRGLVIGSTSGELRWIQPRRILAAACAELGSGGLDSWTTATDSAGVEVMRLARQACRR
jgi:hypothetical protein